MAHLYEREARAIARKLDAIVEKRTNHEIAVIVLNGVRVFHYGIRRGSRTGHDHIPDQIGVNMYQCRKLAACTMSADEYWQHLRSSGEIDVSPEEPEAPKRAVVRRHGKKR